MKPRPADALVFFGATGDLAYKKIFPSLQAMAKRGHLDTPVIGVAKAGWNLEQLRARAKDSLEKHGGLDPAAFGKLSSLLRYVDGDYQDPSTFQALRQELGSASRPAHYLAIPPVMFEVVVEQLAKTGCASNARVIVEKPFGHDAESARELNRVLLGAFDETSLLGKATGEVIKRAQGARKKVALVAGKATPYAGVSIVAGDGPTLDAESLGALAARATRVALGLPAQ